MILREKMVNTKQTPRGLCVSAFGFVWVSFVLLVFFWVFFFYILIFCFLLFWFAGFGEKEQEVEKGERWEIRVRGRERI